MVFPLFFRRGPGCCFWLRLSIPGREQASGDRWNHGRLQAARLIDSQTGRFILNKFQYVAYACNVDCNVTGWHGFNHQKHKNPLLLKGVSSTREPGRECDLNLSAGTCPIMGRGLFLALGIRNRVTVFLKIFFSRRFYDHVQRLFKVKGKVLHCLDDFRPQAQA